MLVMRCFNVIIPTHTAGKLRSLETSNFIRARFWTSLGEQQDKWLSCTLRFPVLSTARFKPQLPQSDSWAIQDSPPVPTKSEGESEPDSPGWYPTPHWLLGIQRFPGWRVTRAERNNASPVRASDKQVSTFSASSAQQFNTLDTLDTVLFYLYNLSIARSPQKLAYLVLLCLSPIIVVTFFFFSFFLCCGLLAACCLLLRIHSPSSPSTPLHFLLSPLPSSLHPPVVLRSSIKRLL